MTSLRLHTPGTQAVSRTETGWTCASCTARTRTGRVECGRCGKNRLGRVAGARDVLDLDSGGSALTDTLRTLEARS